MPCLGMYKRRHKEPEELEFYLDWKDSVNSVDFWAVDLAGDPLPGGRLFGVDKITGNIYLFPGIRSDLGFNLTEDGELTVD